MVTLKKKKTESTRENPCKHFALCSLFDFAVFLPSFLPLKKTFIIENFQHIQK